jgi:threonine synthase
MRTTPPRLACVACGREYPWSLTLLCPDCGGLVDVDYDLSQAQLLPEGPPLARWFDLLPLASRENVIDGGEGNTPCLHARELGRALDLDQLWLKIEGANPTRTTKDRQGSMAIATFRDLGVREFATSSTGNSCTGLARIVARFPELRMHIFVGDEFLDRVDTFGAPNVSVYWLPNGTFVDAHLACQWFAKERGIPSERGFFFFGKREALKCAYLEAVEQVPAPIEWYVQGVSSAMGVYATWKGANQLRALGRIERQPRLLCVQEETCNPMVRSFERGAEQMPLDDVVQRPRGLSKATLRGDPRRVYPYVRRAVLDSGGTMRTTSQDAMRAAKELALKTEGLSLCFTSAMTIAAVDELRRQGVLARDAVVLLNLTGDERGPVADATPDFVVEADGDGFRSEPFEAGRRAGCLARVIGALRESQGLTADQRLDTETPLVEGGLSLDSVALLELVLALEREFDHPIDERELVLANFKTIGSVTDLVRATLAGGRAR